jgi:polyisoprenoid-binding protein YceI
MMKNIRWIAVLFVLSVPLFAESNTWEIDPNHTASQFSIRHLGISTVRGLFEKTSGTVTYDPADPSKTTIDVSIDAATVNTRVERRDNDLRSPNFFDVAKYPTITFKSKRTEAAGSGKLKITGDLTIHGVTKEVVLDVESPTEPINDPMGGFRIGTSATTSINRKDFGVNGAPMMAGEQVQITLDVELKRPK